MKTHLSPVVKTWLFRAWIVTFTGVMLWAGLTSLVSAGRANDAIDAVAVETRIRVDEQCVTAWQAREDIRDIAEQAYRRNAETLISFSTDPVRVAQYRELVEQDVTAIRAELPNPDCGLGAARDRLDD